MSAYTLVSLQRADVAALGHVAAPPAPLAAADAPSPDRTPPLAAHPAWDTRSGWKQHLNNLHLLLQPYVCTGLLLP